jgi:UPF0176 protein
VEKTYLALVHGHPPEDEFAVDAPISEEASGPGAREIEDGGLESRTEFRVLQRHEDGTALLEVRPLTGRTNQIRIHLWHAGFPIVGDPVYLPAGKRGDTQTLAMGDLPMCLHAWKIAFTHPLTLERVSFEAQAPDWSRSFQEP